ncbi:MAG: rhodanese-like domain-containing protein [Acidiferrobacterales bacterium]|nr:rhodanese-like domain-containing protein [Acidiferrobacterales bacterium]
MKIGYKALVDKAMSEVETLSVDDAIALHKKDDVQFVDLRDIRELRHEGKIPQAYHMPRGMLEFWIDPDSPYFKKVFSQDVRFVFYCKSGWRSALATQTAQMMGLGPVCHIGGGFDAWRQSGAQIETLAD